MLVGYGFLFGVYPSLVAETFGVHGLSQNWGTMCLAPILFGNIFNLLYGRIFDHHSYVHDGVRICLDGLSCYRTAYWLTFAASLTASAISLWSIRYDHAKKAKLRKANRDDSREA